jgi:microcompartment protein CcmK/EutM
MKIAKVVGTAISTVKEERLEDTKLLLVCDADQSGKTIGNPYIALDKVGVGTGELVIIVHGSTARVASGDNNTPADAVIVGILDSLSYENKTTFRKS